MSGYVYFAEVGDRIKIGYSAKPLRRIRSVGKTAKLLACIRGERSTEKEMHKKFQAYRLTGEWFSPSEELKQFISQAGVKVRFKPDKDVLVGCSIDPSIRAKMLEIAAQRELKFSDILRLAVREFVEREAIRP